MTITPRATGVVIASIAIVLAGVGSLVRKGKAGKPERQPWFLGHLIVGADGRPSTSKFQLYSWTVVVLCAYVSLYVERCIAGDITPIDTIPANLLIAMGFSSVTAATAKGMTTSFVASGRVKKDASITGGLFTDDDGATDLAKCQLVAWTLVGIAVYLYTLLRADATKGLPNIDGSLMVLMGLGHGTYLGKKLVTTDTPLLLGVTAQARPAEQVTVTGAGFGASSTAGAVLLDGDPVAATTAWADDKISFAFPATRNDGKPWLTGQTVRASVSVAGLVSRDAPLTVGPGPTVLSLAPTVGKAGDLVRVNGSILTPGSSNTVRLVVGGREVPPEGNATETSVTFRVPADMPAGANAVVVEVGGIRAAAQPQFNVQ